MKPRYQIIVEREGAMDVLEVRIEVTEKIFGLELLHQRAFLNLIKKRIRSVVGIDPAVRLVEPRSLPATGNPMARVVDKR